MPAPLAVDRESVKAHAITHGVREAARAFEIPEDTVKAWSRREGWLAPSRTQPPPLPKSIAPRSAPNAPTASEAARNTLERLRDGSKLNLAKAVNKGSAAVARMDGEEIVERSAQVKALADTHAKLWPVEGTGKGTLLGIHVTVRPPDAATTIDAEIVECPAIAQEGT